jgi:tetratricopeptide (TPR) repeat protein
MGKLSKERPQPDTSSSPKKRPASPSKKFDWRPLVIIVLITCAAYYPALQAGYIWDDDFYVTENHLLTAPDGLRRIWFTTESTSQYFPLTYTVFMLERRLWDLNPLGYHLVNIALHAINALLVFLLFTRLGLRGAWMIAAIFALHPVHVESVAWVTELKNVLSGTFCLLALLSYLRFEDNLRWKWYTWSLLLFALALLSKTVVLTLPVVLLLIRWWRKHSITLRDITLLIPFMIVGVGMGLLSMWWEINHQGTTGEVFEFSLLQRILLSGRAIWFYVIKLLWPLNLTFSYPRWILDPREIVQYGWHIGLVGSGILLWNMRDRWGRGPLAGVAIFIITLAPMLGFINYYTMRYSFVADHYQYLASLGLIAVVVEGIRWGFGRWRDSASEVTSRRTALVEKCIGLSVLVILGILTWQQGHIYRDSETLWQDTLKKNSESWIVYNNLSTAVFEKGRIDEGIEYLKKALKINPMNHEAYNNLGIAYIKNGMLTNAITEFNKALSIKPNFRKAHNNLGLVYQKQGKLDEAIFQYKQAVTIDPYYADPHYNLGFIYQKRRKLDEAIFQYKQAVIIDHYYTEAHNNLGLIYEKQGRVDEAIFAYKQAIISDHYYAEAHNNLGNAYVAGGMRDKAISEYKKAISINPTYVKAYTNLGITYGEMKRVEESIETLKKALALKADDPEIHSNLAASYYLQGNHALARSHCDKALARGYSVNPKLLELLEASRKGQTVQ